MLERSALYVMPAGCGASACPPLPCGAPCRRDRYGGCTRDIPLCAVKADLICRQMLMCGVIPAVLRSYPVVAVHHRVARDASEARVCQVVQADFVLTIACWLADCLIAVTYIDALAYVVLPLYCTHALLHMNRVACCRCMASSDCAFAFTYCKLGAPNGTWCMHAVHPYAQPGVKPGHAG